MGGEYYNEVKFIYFLCIGCYILKSSRGYFPWNALLGLYVMWVLLESCGFSIERVVRVHLFLRNVTT